MESGSRFSLSASEPTASSVQNSSTGTPVASSFQNSVAGTGLASSFQNSTTGGCENAYNSSAAALTTRSVRRCRPTKLLASRLVESAGATGNSKNLLGPRLRLCPHCDRKLGLKAYKRHQKLYQKSNVLWIREWKKARDSPDEVPSIKADIEKAPQLPSYHEMDSSDVKYHAEGIEEEHEQADNSNSSAEETNSDDSLTDVDQSEIWDEDENISQDMEANSDSDNQHAPSIPHFPKPEQESINAIVRWMIGFFLSLQARHYLPDASVDALIKFMYIFITITGRFSGFMKQLADIFPKSLGSLLNVAKYEQSFKKYVVCPKCHALYDYDSCKEMVGSQMVSKNCNHMAFPQHPQHSRRQFCNYPLLKSVEFKSGKKYLYPHKIFCYSSLTSSLSNLLSRSGFYDLCNHWKDRGSDSSGRLRDVYDGAIWKEFQSDFLNSFSVGLMLNIDWFQPYSHTTFSVGVIYLSIMNLPRHIRSKRENIILLGVIPGPHEPSHNVNTYLSPLVRELLTLLDGIPVTVLTSSGTKHLLMKAFLLCVACNLPATRKTCGFLSHSATLGCSKCLQSFVGSVGSMNYSGFNYSTWIKRTNEQHRKNVKEIAKCKTKSTRHKKEAELGCRYSLLLELPYFDAVRMHVIDPMHNLMLGSGKHMIVIWQRASLIQPSHFEHIQNIVDRISVPSDIGRIPLKIGSGFSGFKADQFKNWINIYSIPSLFGILPTDSFECWRHYVLACRLLCQQSLSVCDINLAHALLIQFCTKVQDLYGESSVTPNMHLHPHLRDVICDYGPMQEFWCFSFERFNGILGKQPTNNRSIEAQLMRRFLRDNFVSSFDYPEMFKDEFNSVLSSCTTQFRGSLSETMLFDEYKLSSKHTRDVFPEAAVSGLRDFLAKTEKVSSSQITVNSVFEKYNSLTLKGKVFSSTGKKTKFVIAMTLWDDNIYGNPPTTLPSSIGPNTNVRPVNIHYYAKVFYSVNNASHDIVLAFVSWFFPHPHRYDMGKPAEFWCDSMFESLDYSSSFILLENIQCRCAHTVMKYKEENLLVVIPLVE